MSRPSHTDDLGWTVEEAIGLGKANDGRQRCEHAWNQPGERAPTADQLGHGGTVKTAEEGEEEGGGKRSRRRDEEDEGRDKAAFETRRPGYPLNQAT